MDNPQLIRRSVILSALAGSISLPLAASSRADEQVRGVLPSAPANISDWMSWQGGVDLVAMTDASLSQPNVIVHLANVVHTPVGSAPAGMVFYQPDAGKSPLAMGFVSPDPKVAAYFGPHVFKGTPFETAEALNAKIIIDESHAPASVSSRLTVGGHLFEVTLAGLSGLSPVNRPTGAMPFTQQGLEAVAGKVSLKVDGKDVSIIVPPVGMSGGAAAVWAPAGLYAR